MIKGLGIALFPYLLALGILGNLPSPFVGINTIVRARLDERRKKLSCQRDLSSRIGLFCPQAVSSEVPLLKVAVFRELQIPQTVFRCL